TQGIRELWQRGGFKTKQVTMGVANQRVVVREVTVPSLPPKELRQALPYQVQDLIPLPVDEAVLDFDVLDEVEQEGARMLRLLVVAAQREMLNQLVLCAQNAKLDPVGVDLVPFALIRAVGQDEGLGLDESEAGGEAIVDIGADVTNICVHERGVARFVRILPSAGNDVTAGVAASLAIDEDEAEALKRGQPLTGTSAAPEARSILRGRISNLADEIRSSLDFYRAQTPGADVTRVLVTGGGSKMPGLIQLLGERGGAEVQQGRAFGKVQVRLSMDEETMADAEPLLAVAVGLALPQG
ncbi:MAG: type IV pilus assembly protein PilM, partial [Actinomycetota bacterium]|nr:type IV pilus assembly protein PilM [Actinomycetota bacterium]